ncbi:hypothetical protein Tco_0009899 [Tanacetum coccineum]
MGRIFYTVYTIDWLLNILMSSIYNDEWGAKDPCIFYADYTQIYSTADDSEPQRYNMRITQSGSLATEYGQTSDSIRQIFSQQTIETTVSTCMNVTVYRDMCDTQWCGDAVDLVKWWDGCVSSGIIYFVQLLVMVGVGREIWRAVIYDVDDSKRAQTCELSARFRGSWGGQIDTEEDVALTCVRIGFQV